MNGIYALLAAIFLGIDSKAQTILPEKEGYIFYEVIDTAGSNKNDLFEEARKWLLSSYKQPRESLKEEDKETGQLIGKGTLSYTLRSGSDAVIEVIVKINVRNNKYRIQVYDFQGHFLTGRGSAKETRTPINLYTDLDLYKKGKANKMIIELIEGLNDEMDLLLQQFKSAMKNSRPASNEAAAGMIK